jgi:hypothetical protein
VANAPACLLWATVYAGIGVAGGSIFPEPWEGVVAAVLLILIVNQSISWFTKRRAASKAAAELAQADSAEPAPADSAEPDRVVADEPRD